MSKKQAEIEEMANSFRGFEGMYEDLLEGGVEALYHPIELEWMLEYFQKNEDYEKCEVLKCYINKEDE